MEVCEIVEMRAAVHRKRVRLSGGLVSMLGVTESSALTLSLEAQSMEERAPVGTWTTCVASFNLLARSAGLTADTTTCVPFDIKPCPPCHYKIVIIIVEISNAKRLEH